MNTLIITSKIPTSPFVNKLYSKSSCIPSKNILSLTTNPSKFNSNFNYLQIRCATKKAGGSTKNGRDSHSKRLGVKKFGGYYIQL